MPDPDGFRDPADYSEASYERHPVEDIEPRERRALAMAEALGRLLEWISRGRTVLDIGQRSMVLLYHIRPDLIGGLTLAQIGGEQAKSRQAVGKIADDFRDTFRGFKGPNQRGDDHRHRCRAAQGKARARKYAAIKPTHPNA